MLFTFGEIMDVFITTIAAGFIFMDMLRRTGETRSFSERLVFSSFIAAPAIILHELGHKFTALALGYQATFHASYTWLGIGVLLKLIGFPFLFIVPAYVSIIGGSGLGQALVAAAGPLVNGFLWLGSTLALKYGKNYSRDTQMILYYTKTINGFLCIFNFLPIPSFDGWTVWTNIFHVL